MLSLIVWIIQFNLNIAEIPENHLNNLLEIIQKLDNIYDFQNFIFLTSHEFYIPNNMLQLNNKPKIIAGNVEYPSNKLRHLIHKNSLNIVAFKDIDSYFLSNFVNKNLRGLHGLKTLFIEIDTDFWFQNSTKVFQNKIYQRGFLNSIYIHNIKVSTKVGKIIFYKNKLGAIFEDITKEPIIEWFSKGISKILANLNVKIPHILNDVPRIFEINCNVNGFSGRLFYEFLNNMNVKYEIVNVKRKPGNPFSAVWFNEVKSLIFSDSLDLSPYVYTTFPIDHELLSYPLEASDWCLMVPMEKEVPKEAYIVMPFHIYSWLAILIGFFIIGLSLKIITWTVNCKCEACILEGMCLTMNLPSYRVPDPPWMIFLVYCGIFIYGFIISNFYLALLTSSLTTVVYDTKIEKISDVVKSNLYLEVDYVSWDYLQRVSRNFSALLELKRNRTIINRASSFVKRRNSLEANRIFPIAKDIWEFLEMQQQFMKSPLFRLTNICFTNSFSSFLMKNDSPLEDPLNNFILASKESGLFQFWKDESFKVAVRAALAFFKRDIDRNIPLGMDFFLGLSVFLFYGLALAGLGFIYEVLSFWVLKRCRK